MDAAQRQQRRTDRVRLLIDGTRALLDIVEANPHLPLSHVNTRPAPHDGLVQADIVSLSPEEFLAWTGEAVECFLPDDVAIEVQVERRDLDRLLWLSTTHPLHPLHFLIGGVAGTWTTRAGVTDADRVDDVTVYRRNARNRKTRYGKTTLAALRAAFQTPRSPTVKP